MRAALPQAEVPAADVQAQFKAVAWAMRSAKDTHVAACAHVLQARRYYPNTAVVSLVTKNIRDFGVKKLATLKCDQDVRAQAAFAGEVRRTDTVCCNKFGRAQQIPDAFEDVGTDFGYFLYCEIFRY